jgi:hypothetical protein
MARAQAQYLRIYDATGVTYQRWQSYYVNSTVTWDSAVWQYVPFAADGFTAGISGDETDISVVAPATTTLIAAFESAINNGRLAELDIYQFDTLLGNEAPQLDQQLIAGFTGQVVGGTGGLTNITVQLGSALSPIGAQVPPRKLITQLIGKGCKL